jgi:RNA polymerase sigma factor (sigma-70 family)
MPRQGAELRHVHSLFNVGTQVGLSDGQLVDRFTTRSGEGAELAFAALVERHGGLVLSVCRSILRDEHEAQDAFQATFLVLVKKAGVLRVRETLGPWLHAVACRVANCARSSGARRRRHERKAAAMTGQFLTRSVRDDLGSVLHEELNHLLERYRAPIVLCDLEGLTREQAASRLGWPVGTVQSRLARGRACLRGRLTRRGLAPSIVALVGTSTIAARAAVPSALLDLTVSTALWSAGGAALNGVVPMAVVALADQTMRVMLMTKWKITAIAALAAGAIVTTAGVYGSQSPTRESSAAEPQSVTVTQVATSDKPFAPEIASLAREAAKRQQRGDVSGALDTLRRLEEQVREWDRALRIAGPASFSGRPAIETRTTSVRTSASSEPAQEPTSTSEVSVTATPRITTTAPATSVSTSTGSTSRPEFSQSTVVTTTPRTTRVEGATSGASAVTQPAGGVTTATTTSPSTSASGHTQTIGTTVAPHSTDHELRLQELERKLEQILKAIEKSKSSN